MTSSSEQHPKERKKQLLYLDKSTPEEFQNAKLMDWIYLVGDISTQYELDFVRHFGHAMIHRPYPAPAPLEKFVLHLVHINQKLDETKRILKTYRRGDLTTEEEDDAAELRGYRDALNWALIPDSKTTLAEHDAAIARKAREEVLGLARDMYGLMMCVEKINTDEFMEYYAERMKGLKEQYESLRSTAPHTEQEQP